MHQLLRYVKSRREKCCSLTTTFPCLGRKMRISLSTFIAGGLVACSLVASSVQGSAIGIRNAQLTLASVDGSNEKVEK